MNEYEISEIMVDSAAIERVLAQRRKDAKTQRANIPILDVLRQPQ
jgi:hypothetical protein